MKRKTTSDLKQAARRPKATRDKPLFPNLTRELIDHIVSFIHPVFEKERILSILHEPLHTADKSQFSLWSTIFKSDKWLKKMEESKITPLLIGSQLELVGKHDRNDESEPVYIGLLCPTETKNKQCLGLFMRCLQEHTKKGWGKNSLF